jgi:hypothetical protein
LLYFFDIGVYNGGLCRNEGIPRVYIATGKFALAQAATTEGWPLGRQEESDCTPESCSISISIIVLIAFPPSRHLPSFIRAVRVEDEIKRFEPEAGDIIVEINPEI